MPNFIPIIDLKGASSLTEEGRKLLAKTLVSSFHDVGFAYLINHGVCPNKVAKAFSVSKQFFERPLKDKLIFRKKNATEGYHGAYALEDNTIKEELITNEVNHTSSAFDFRESFDFFGKSDFSEISCDPIDREFCESMQTLRDACQNLCTHLLQLLAIGLHLDDESYFITRFKWLQSNSITSFKTFRALYYPAIPPSMNIPQGQARVKEHSDHGFFTLLFQDNIGGLEVKDTGESWIPAEPIPNSIVVNIGDLLEFWSGGFLKATKHRVLIPDREIQLRNSRQSIVYFLHPDADTTLSPFVSSLIRDYTFHPMLAGDFAKAKLAAVKSY